MSNYETLTPPTQPVYASNQGAMFCSAPTVYNQRFFPDRIEPSTTDNAVQKLIPLNDRGIRLDSRYTKIKTDVNNCKTGYVSQNPLTYDSPRAIRTVFDKPNYTGDVNVGNVPVDEIYAPMYSRYGKGYTDYRSINAGQIQYYLNDTQIDAYDQPVFTSPAVVHNRLFVDPNELVLPQYDRFPLNGYAWNATCVPAAGGKATKRVYDACDSFTHDSMGFREDLMARQMRKMNQQDWSKRWGPALLQ